MADGVWKDVYLYTFWRSKQLSQNKFLIRALLLGEKVATEEKKMGENGEKLVGGKKKRLMKIVATTSLPAVDRPNADRWNAAIERIKDL